MQIFDYICLGICCLHILFVIIEFCRGLVFGKKIDRLCTECGMPIYKDSSEHECWELFSSMPKDEVVLITQFIDFLRSRGSDDGDK